MGKERQMLKHQKVIIQDNNCIIIRTLCMNFIVLTAGVPPKSPWLTVSLQTNGWTMTVQADILAVVKMVEFL